MVGGNKNGEVELEMIHNLQRGLDVWQENC